jgi:AcrR family transcriptional regulator
MPAEPATETVPVRRRVLDAARDCFKRYGVVRTRIEDVAQTAGISRPLLYQYFDGRQGLIAALAEDEIERIIEENRKRLPVGASFAETVLEGSLAAIESGRSENLLPELFEASTLDDLPSLLLDPTRAPYAAVSGLWKPVFDRARETGELRSDLDDADLIEWLASVHYAFLLRPDVDPKRQRQLFELFLIPALLSGAPAPAIPKRSKRKSS